MSWLPARESPNSAVEVSFKSPWHDAGFITGQTLFIDGGASIGKNNTLNIRLPNEAA
jgi:hypothetical protein